MNATFRRTFAAILFSVNLVNAAPFGSAFTYQGVLGSSGTAANGAFNFEFRLFDAPVDGTGLGPVAVSGLAVSNGLFIVNLDFGPGAFDGSARWLEIRVQGAGDPGFFTLSPRAPIQTSPYALLAGTVLDGAISSNKISNGAIGTAQLAVGAVTAQKLAAESVTAGKLASGAAFANLYAGGQSGVASGGIVLSEDANNGNLIDAGYVRIAKVDLVPERWTNNAPGPPAVGTSAERSEHTAVWTGTEMIIWGGYNGSYRNDGLRYNPSTDSWTATTKSGAPSARRGHSAVWTGTEMIVWGGPDNRGGRYNPATDSWITMNRSNAPSGRTGNAAVWTGSHMLIWGGGDNSGAPQYGNGSKYNPTTDVWTDMSNVNAPYKRDNMAFVWTGSRLIVWSGRTLFSAADCAAVGPPGCIPGSYYYWNDGAKYNPTADTWAAMAASPLNWRENAAAVWTGSDMIIWGGDLSPHTAFAYGYTDGARYTPSTDNWTVIAPGGAPEARTGFTAIWGGNRMVIWGGIDFYFGDALGSGRRYDPSTDSWAGITSNGAPDPRANHTAVWTSSRMIVFGGDDGTSDFFADAFRYNVASNSWTGTSLALLGSEPSEREGATAVWTGTEMIVWGGEYQGVNLHSGGRYDPILNDWTQTKLTGAPSGRINHTAVWTGKEMIIWGGMDEAETATGAAFNPATHQWRTLTVSSNTPSARQNHTAVWTGKEMIIWGGVSNIFLAGYGDLPNEFASGGRYDPKTDSWTPTAFGPNHPFSRQGHLAVWTGTEMIIWGGYNSLFALSGPTKNYRADAARYDPASDSWTAVPPADALTPRRDASGIWSGSEFIVWGGYDGLNQQTGARFNPANNTWTATDTNAAPVQRNSHAAFWDGTHMIIWGGKNGSGPRNDGSRYDPLTDTWTQMAYSSTPALNGNAIVWTGLKMITVGGVEPGGIYHSDNNAYTPPRTTYLYLKP